MYKVITKILNVAVRILFRVEVKGIENVPKEGACILACNHKSNWDPVFIAGLINSRVVNGVAKKELFDVPVLKYILKKCFVIPVNRDNPDISTIKTILKVLKNGGVIGIFPEGTRHKDLNTFSEAKAGLGMFAVKGKSEVVPISIITNYKLFSKVVIYIDKPMNFEEFYGKRIGTNEYEEISDRVMNVIKDNYFKNQK